MKITDILPIEKKTTLPTRTYTWGTGKAETYCIADSVTKKYFEKHKFYYPIDILSNNKYWLMNNVDKDIVVAYISERFCKFFLIKKKNGYIGLTWIARAELDRRGYTQFDFDITDKKQIIEVMSKNEDILQIVDKEQFEIAKREILLEKIEEQNEN